MNELVFDLQRFTDNNSSIGSLERLGNIINVLNLKTLANEFLNSGKNVTEYFKTNTNPVLNFIGTYLEAKAKEKSDTGKKLENYATVITSTVLIINSSLDIVAYAKEKNTIAVSKNIGSIVSELTKMVKAVVKLNNGSSNKASLVLGIVASAASLVANSISSLDGLDDDEKAKLNKAYVELMKSFGPELVKKIFNDAISSEIKKASVKDLEVVKKNISLFRNVSNNLTKAGGVLDLIFAFTNGIMNGWNKYKATLKKYTEDNIPEDLAKRDAVIDAITAVIYDTAHTYTKGLDDVLFKGTQTLISWITGKQPATQGNYVEVITDLFKAFNFKNTGTADGDYILSFEDNMMIYGADGDDYIGNMFSGMTIYGGHDNDSIISRLNSSNGSSTPQGNSFFGGPGEDFIVAYDTGSTIDGGTDSDGMVVFGTKNKIYGGDSIDVISLRAGANNNTVSGGHGDDGIFVENAKNTVIEYNEGDGNDLIFGYDESDTLRINSGYTTQTSGADVIVAVGNSSITLKGAAGKEININGTKQTVGLKPTNPPLIITLPSVWYPDVKVIRGTNGKDTIRNTLSSVMIEGLAGDDYIYNAYGDSVSISGGDGNDTIYNWKGENLTIDGGAGDDTIRNYYSDSVSISGGAGNDSISNDSDNVTIDGRAGNDSIDNDYGDSVSISGGTGEDSIRNTGVNATIDGGVGNDYISNGGSNVTINGGEGDDSIGNSGYNVTIDGGAGDDTIRNYGGNSVSISGGEGDDSIGNSGYNVTIDGGDGNDFVSLNYYSNNILIEYKIGDGNDIIYGFKKDSTLKIIGASYSSVKSGSDIIFTVGNGKITLKDAASLSGITPITTPPDTTPTALNLTNTKNKITVTGSTLDDTISNSGANVTITGGIGGDSIHNSGANVLLDGGAGSDTIYSNGNKVTINGVGGDDDIYNYGDSVKINGGENYDLIINYGAKVTIDGDTGNDFIYSNASDVSINGGDGSDTISNYGDKATISGGKNNDDITNLGSNVRFKYTSGDGNDIIEGFDETSTLQIGDGKGTYSFTVSGDDAIVTVGNGKITLKGAASLSAAHIDGNGSTVPPAPTEPLNLTNKISYKTINGTSYNDSIWNEGTSVTINAAAGNDSIYNNSTYVFINGSDGDDYIENGYYSIASNATINGGTGNDTIWNGETQVTINGGNGNDSIYSYASNVTIDSGEGNDTLWNDWGQNVLFQYSAGDGNDLITGFDATSTLSISGAAYTRSTVGNDIIVTVDDGSITLQGAANLSKPNIAGKEISKATWKLNGTTATYGNSITVSGVKSLDGISLKNKTVTISAKALDGKAVTVSNGYTLALGSDVAKSSTTAAKWASKSGTYTYTAAKTSAGYSLASNKISYSAASGGQQFSITGLKNTSAVTVSGKKVTIGNASLNGKAVTVSNGYTLALASNVPKVSTSAASWTNKSGTYTYTAAKTSAGYSLANNKISYTATSGGEQFSITGLKNTSAVTISSKKVTVGNASLNGKAVTLNGDFTLALAKDVATSAKKTAGAFSTVSKGTATYKATSLSGYYKLRGKKISYTAATSGQAITFKNLNTSTNLAAVKKGITVAEQSNGSYKITFQNAGVLTTKAPTVSAAKGVKYTVAVADSLKPTTKAAWNISGTTAILRSDTTAGYTVSKNAVVYSAKKNGSPLIELTNLAKNVKANAIITKGKVITLNASVLGTKTAIKSNNGGYSFSLTGNASGKKFTGTSKADTLSIAANNANVDAGAGNDVVTVGGLKVTLSGGAGNDQLTGGKNADWIYGSAGNDSILGNAGNDKLFGDAGNDSLRGGAGNDTLIGGKGNDHLWGDAGKDTFLYSNGDGKDVIHGFESGDLLQITGTFSASYNSSKKEIAFKVGSTANAITLTDFGKTTTFHVNNDVYQISGSKLIKK